MVTKKRQLSLQSGEFEWALSFNIVSGERIWLPRFPTIIKTNIKTDV